MEHYKDIKGSNVYEVSNIGNVRNKVTGKLLTPQLNRPTNGYLRVTTDVGRKYIHRLMVETFFDLDPKHGYVRHIDGDRLNNELSNLEIIIPVKVGKAV